MKEDFLKTVSVYLFNSNFLATEKNLDAIVSSVAKACKTSPEHRKDMFGFDRHLLLHQ